MPIDLHLVLGGSSFFLSQYVSYLSFEDLFNLILLLIVKGVNFSKHILNFHLSLNLMLYVNKHTQFPCLPTTHSKSNVNILKKVGYLPLIV